MHEILKYISVGEMVAILSFIITGVGAVISVTIGVRRMIDKGLKQVKADVCAQIEAFEKAQNERDVDFQAHKASVWRRLDEMKTSADTRFISREICSLMHQDTAKTVNKLEAKFDSFETKMGAKIDALMVQVARISPEKVVG